MMTCTLNGGPDMVTDGRDLEAGRRMPGKMSALLYALPGHSYVIVTMFSVMCSTLNIIILH